MRENGIRATFQRPFKEATNSDHSDPIAVAITRLRPIRNLLTDNEITINMSRRDECQDNAVVESFFGTLKNELINRAT